MCHILCQVTRVMSSETWLAKTLFESEYQTYDSMLNIGAPGTKWRKRAAELIENATHKRINEETNSDASLMQYGAPAGDPRFLRALTDFLTEQYGDTVDLNTLVATSGASSGLFYILNMVFPGKCTVFCEEISYMIALEVFKTLEYPVVPVPIESDGIDVEILEKLFKEERKKHDFTANSNHKFWAFLYLIPTFHNPTGRVLSPEKSQKIVELARKYDILVLCDDVYNLLYYEGSKPPKRLFAYDNRNDPDYKGNVISNGSFSKLLAPGIRLGWMEMPVSLKEHWDKHPLLSTGGCLNFFCSGVVASALEDGSVSEFVNQLRADYCERAGAVHETLQSSLPQSCSYEIPKGGYFFWLTLPQNCSCAILHERAKTQRIRFQEGPRYRQVSPGCCTKMSYYIWYKSPDCFMQETIAKKQLIASEFP